MAKDLRYWMSEAYSLAETAATAGEVPVGAVITKGDSLIASAENRMQRDGNPLAHAEMLAVQAACRQLANSGLPGHRLDGCSLFVTLEPCAMCAMALSHARLERLVFGAYDTKSGGVENGARIYTHTATHHKPQIIGGVMEEDCGKLMQDFFKTLRNA